MNEVVLNINTVDTKKYMAKKYTIQLWGLPRHIPAIIGQIRWYGNAQTQNFICSNSAIRIFVDLTQSSRQLALFTSRRSANNTTIRRLYSRL